ncbi:MAG: hypothetical protein IM607_07745 [Cytophagales bacterium]|nr:hypothetical protein [Cytophagales bacterium]
MTNTPKPVAGQLSAEESHLFVKLYTAMAFGSEIDHAMVGNKRIDFETMTDGQAIMLANHLLRWSTPSYTQPPTTEEKADD